MGKRSEVVFGNRMSSQIVKKAENSKERFVKRFGDDSDVDYPLAVVKNPYIGDSLGVSNIVIDGGVSDDIPDGGREEFDRDKGIIVGNIRMGFGHYRISMAIASAANHLGYKPYWMDLNSYSETTGGKVIEAQNKLYSLGSRISGKSKVFNKAVWEPMNYEGFRKLSYNASDQMNAELMTPVFRNVPKDIPLVATHVWPAQAAVHAGMKHVVNAIPDNWPMALHLAEGSLHTVQTRSAYLGYRTLNGMQGDEVLKPMPGDSIRYVGHYIDHELVAAIEEDCDRRIERRKKKAPIAVMNVLLQQEDTETNQNLKAELFRVEQYVEMALGYVRLDSGTKDLVIAWYPLDEIVRKSIRKYAGQFIRRRIRLIYEGTDQIVLTDEKWLSFIIEQLLSNAVKYTLKGTVTITVSEEKKLTVTDTGMGIAPEDLPRIFEKGYTGYNGRMERKSTGIGLYLSQMAAKKLGHQITVESKLGEGSSFTIGLAEYPLRSE